MRFSILGYSQRRLLDLGLGMDEAMLLRWFVEYQATGKMRSMVIGGKSFTWVNFTGVLSDIPVIGGSAKTISRRFDRLEAAGVMEHRTVREGGVYSYYRINEEVYTSLIDDVATWGEECAREGTAGGWTDLSNGNRLSGGTSGGEDAESREPEEKQAFAGEENPAEGGMEPSDHETDLSNGETDLSDHETKVSEQMTHTQDTYTRHEEPPVIPPVGKGTAKAGRKAATVVIPSGISGTYREALEAFGAFRVEIGFPLTQKALDLTVGKLATLGSDGERVRCIEWSIECRYRGVFPDCVGKQTDARSGRQKPLKRYGTESGNMGVDAYFGGEAR